jgi:hypothetical protein
MTPTITSLWFGGTTGISNVMDLTLAKAVVGLIMPSDWTPAAVSIEGSADGTNFYPMYDGRGGALLSFVVPPGAMVAIDPNRMRCCKAFRLLSGTRAKLVPQGVAREFFVVTES